MNTDKETHNHSPFEKNIMDTVEENENIVKVLNSLVQINNDRIEGYGHAADQSEDNDLKILFNKMILKSQSLKTPLINEVLKYGGEPTESTTTLGKVFRVWMDFKATLTGKDRKAILQSCEYGEGAAQDTYSDAIKEGKHLPAYITQMIIDQKSSLLEDLNHVRVLRETE